MRPNLPNLPSIFGRKSLSYAVEAELSQKVRSLAEQRGVSAETLLNLWVQEKVTEAVAAD